MGEQLNRRPGKNNHREPRQCGDPVREGWGGGSDFARYPPAILEIKNRNSKDIWKLVTLPPALKQKKKKNFSLVLKNLKINLI